MCVHRVSVSNLERRTRDRRALSLENWGRLFISGYQDIDGEIKTYAAKMEFAYTVG